MNVVCYSCFMFSFNETTLNFLWDEGRKRRLCVVEDEEVFDVLSRCWIVEFEEVTSSLLQHNHFHLL